jgi:hypothetical protein
MLNTGFITPKLNIPKKAQHPLTPTSVIEQPQEHFH